MSSSEPNDNDFQDLFENAPCGYLSLGPDGRIIKVNTTLCTWLKRPPDDLLGKRLRELLTIAGSIFYETHFAPLLRMQGFFEEVALDLSMPDGPPIPVLANAVERVVSENLVVTRITLFRATQRRRHERDLVDARSSEQEARRELETAFSGLQTRMSDSDARETLATREAELREQFIAVLGHDLRNPLAGLLGGTNILSQIHSDAKSVRVIRLMRESISRMGGLIDNLMDFARGRLGDGIGIEVTSGKRIEPTLAQVVNEMKAGQPERDIEVSFDLPQTIAVDHDRIAQMFSNLLGNAVTHGAKDQPVRVEARLENDVFLLAVANGGEPIPQTALDRLFQPFSRGERPSMNGLGLGLFIASQIAQAHGGRIDVQSDDRETRFTFRMPIADLP